MAFGTILRTFVGAFFGALFGYILGLIIELFPGLNMAMLNGLQAITGMSGISIPALLTAIGFMAGAIIGILASLLIFIISRGAYARWLHRCAHEFGHSFRHWNMYAMRYHRCYRVEDEPKDGSVEDTIRELDGYLSYLEDLPGDRLAAYEDRMSRLNDRLHSLKVSLHQQWGG
jgi:hypothetical protein